MVGTRSPTTRCRRSLPDLTWQRAQCPRFSSRVYQVAGYRRRMAEPDASHRTATRPSTERSGPDAPAHRYDAALAQEIEARWQDRWEEEGTFEAPNPVGDLSVGFDEVARRPKAF